MKNLDLNSYGVQEMNEQEINNIDGGFFGIMDIIMRSMRTEYCDFSGAGWGPAYA